ncbi:LOW QUALITY PROTEIN: protein-lysine 6-oxidase-like [Drosophila sulfurigaster albostrigata]|uniref:LOW QUALITY PROTEIN: protein-lysine 6-oxidase-like n=1 Tax=Drosophila sulfurigaster albostrigata TaxID=89887 RepID=UPI002D21D266|nr:LOW QUALITY PROTEIN: protein-lysine 6-oxidase-like [Drosophila sulfurigaster albostrigata]
MEILPVLLLLLGLLPAMDANRLNVNNNFRKMQVRLRTNRTRVAHPIREGRVEVSFDYGETWGTICSNNWTKREGNVVCRQLGLGYASMATMSTQHGDTKRYPLGMVGISCRGSERRLSECRRESRFPVACGSSNRNVATVACVNHTPDLELGLKEIEVNAFLDSVPMTNLTCAMEENCLSADAYIIRRTNPSGIRKLLRFAVKAKNVGDADVSPYANYRDWTWHQCHMHFHSVTVFATFDVYNQRYEKVAQGHKASFCLEDTECNPGVNKKYTCGNTTQGISPGCADVYSTELDCQWVDVTTVPINHNYILRVALNPEHLLPEKTFENNGAECVLHYTGDRRTTKVTNCVRKSLWV